MEELNQVRMDPTDPDVVDLIGRALRTIDPEAELPAELTSLL